MASERESRAYGAQHSISHPRGDSGSLMTADDALVALKRFLKGKGSRYSILQQIIDGQYPSYSGENRILHNLQPTDLIPMLLHEVLVSFGLPWEEKCYILNLLLDTGANIEAVYEGKTPLQHAMLLRELQAAELFVARGANKHGIRDLGVSLYSAAEKGCNEIVKALLTEGAKPDVAYQYGETPLFAAARNGHQKVVMSLLNANANKDLANQDGETPLHSAACNGHRKVVELLRGAQACAPTTGLLQKVTPTFFRFPASSSLDALTQSSSTKRSKNNGHFSCAITEEVMRPPVVEEDGYTSEERRAIEAWFSKSTLSPMAVPALGNRELNPHRSIYDFVGSAGIIFTTTAETFTTPSISDDNTTCRRRP